MDMKKWEPLKMDEQRSIYEMLSMKGKVALITGGSGGIGRASAIALAELGADIVITGTQHSEQKLQEYSKYISERYGVKVWGKICDVSDEESVEELFAFIRAEVGDLHVCFSNAGYFSMNDNVNQSVEDFKRMLDVDVTGSFLVCRKSAEIMIEKGHDGSIILNASMTAHIVNRIRDNEHPYICYPAAKSAVLHMTRALALEYAKHNIRVNSVSPGYILSGIHKNSTLERFEWTSSNIPMKRYGTLDEIVGSVVYYATDLSAYTTGADLLVDGGYCIW
jgi:sorbose reductase